MNKNKTVEWINGAMKNKISISLDILDRTKNRGIYGFFVIDKSCPEEFCAYVGKAVNIYGRMFCGEKAHLVKLKKDAFCNSVINEAMKNEEKRIVIRVLEEVTFHYENYNKDMQLMASRECHYIDKYQGENQCLEQLPDGRNVYENIWENEKTESGKH